MLVWLGKERVEPLSGVCVSRVYAFCVGVRMSEKGAPRRRREPALTLGRGLEAFGVSTQALKQPPDTECQPAWVFPLGSGSCLESTFYQAERPSFTQPRGSLLSPIFPGK